MLSVYVRRPRDVSPGGSLRRLAAARPTARPTATTWPRSRLQDDGAERARQLRRGSVEHLAGGGGVDADTDTVIGDCRRCVRFRLRFRFGGWQRSGLPRRSSAASNQPKAAKHVLQFSSSSEREHDASLKSFAFKDAARTLGERWKAPSEEAKAPYEASATTTRRASTRRRRLLAAVLVMAPKKSKKREVLGARLRTRRVGRRERTRPLHALARRRGRCARVDLLLRRRARPHPGALYRLAAAGSPAWSPTAAHAASARMHDSSPFAAARACAAACALA